MANVVKPPCDEGVIQAGSSTVPCSKPNQVWVLAATILGSSLAMIDSSVVNVALPTLQSRLNATAAQVQWVVESYALFLAALILVGGSLGDRYGRRKIFAIGIVVFAIASILCGISFNAQQLIAARAVQGVGGALLVPGSLAIISASFEKQQRGRAIGTWSGFTAMTSALGPVVGGWLIENASWRSIFFLNVPLAAIALAISFWRVPESQDEAVSGKLDLRGASLATIGLGSLVYGLIESAQLNLTHPMILIAFCVGIVALIAFVWTELSVRSPMLPLTLFRSKTFSGANLLTLLLYGGLGGVLFFFPFNLIQVQGYSATAAGAAFLPLILLMFILSRWSGGLVSQYGAKRPLMVGTLIAAIGFALFAVPGVGGSYWLTFFPAIVILGLGMAITVAPLTTTVMEAVPVQHSGTASGINNAVARTAGLLAIAVFGVVMAHRFNQVLDQQFTALQIPAEIQTVMASERVKLAGANIPKQVNPATAFLIKQAITQSFVSGFRWVMFVAASLAILSTITAAFTMQPQHSTLPQRQR